VIKRLRIAGIKYNLRKRRIKEWQFFGGG